MSSLLLLLSQSARGSFQRRLPALLALIAGGLLAIGLLSAGGSQQPVVALVLPDNPSPETALAAEILTDPGAALPFRLAGEAEAREAVASGRWDCAFLLSADLQERRPVTLLRSNSTLLDGPASEAVSAALLHVLSPSIAADYLEDSGMLAGRPAEEVQALLAERMHNDRPMGVELLGSGGSLTLDADSAAPVIRWCLAVALLLDLLLCAVRLKAARGSGWYGRALPVAGRIPLELSALLGNASALLPIVLLLPAACCLLPGFGSPGRELGLLLLWWAAVLPLPLAAERLFRRGEVLCVALPVLLAACLLLCPALFDAGRIFPALAPLSRLLPPTWYLLTAAGSSALPLLLGGSACWALGLAALLIPRRRG